MTLRKLHLLCSGERELCVVALERPVVYNISRVLFDYIVLESLLQSNL
jgi:hypothetical protein